MRKITVKLPSDRMTAKERKELNGMAVTYTMNEPHTYYELLAFPKDLRKEYLEGIINRYAPSTTDLTKMLHIKTATLNDFLKSLEIEKPRVYRNPAQKFEWRVFMGENITPPEPEPEPFPVLQPVKDIPAPVTPAIGKIDHLSIHVVGKPFAVANGIPALLDSNKNYYFSINISEVEDKETIEDTVCGTGEAC